MRADVRVMRGDVGVMRGDERSYLNAKLRLWTQRSVSHQYLGEFGYYLGDLANIWVDYHPSSQSRRDTYGPDVGSEG